MLRSGQYISHHHHKGLGIYYLLTAFIFGISGTLISVLIRIELYSSGNRIISPENQNFYNITITLHGFLMIFFLGTSRRWCVNSRICPEQTSYLLSGCYLHDSTELDFRRFIPKRPFLCQLEIQRREFLSHSEFPRITTSHTFGLTARFSVDDG